MMKELIPELRGEGLSIGIVMSRFNGSISEHLLNACAAKLKKLGVTRITLARVPGALEIPIVLQAMSASCDFDALIALGAVIRGETYHFDIVAHESASGISHLMLKNRIPIVNGILTTNTIEQAQVRTVEKAVEAACVAVEMANLLKMIRA